MSTQKQPVAQLLPTFQLEKVLSESPTEKKVALLGRFEGQEGDAILLLSRQHFIPEQLQGLLTSCCSVTTDFENDIYGKYTAQVGPEYGAVILDTIYPATAQHIQKHTTQERHMVTESPELYCRVVQPYIAAIPPKRTQWVRNILSKQAEADRLIFEDFDPVDGFMIHPDLKWDQVNMRQLYCVVLCHRSDIGSLRDLTQEHLPLLQGIRSKAVKVISHRYNVPADQLRLFVHYPPSYYHFHVHVTHVAWEGAGALVGKAHLLDDIIGNISAFDSGYYQKATVTYTLGESDDLWGQLQAAQPHA